jgi:hypothetical protein
MVRVKNILATLAAAVGISACTSMNIFKDSQTPEAPPPLEAQQPVEQALSSTQIRSVLSGKSWKWQGPNNSGTTLYAADGTSLVEVDGKGTTSGKWETRDGQLCESFAPAPFLPQGMNTVCQPFSGSGGSYQVGPATFTQA